MTPKDIRRILFDRDLTVQGLSEKIGCRRQELSMTISGARPYPEIRKKLARELGIREGKLFPTNSVPAAPES